MSERRECWWCELVPGTPNENGHPAKAPHIWWRRDVDGLLIDICGPCWIRRDLRAELAGRRHAAEVGSRPSPVLTSTRTS